MGVPRLPVHRRRRRRPGRAWRRGRDSNPRALAGYRFSKPAQVRCNRPIQGRSVILDCYSECLTPHIEGSRRGSLGTSQPPLRTPSGPILRRRTRGRSPRPGVVGRSTVSSHGFESTPPMPVVRLAADRGAVRAGPPHRPEARIETDPCVGRVGAPVREAARGHPAGACGGAEDGGLGSEGQARAVRRGIIVRGPTSSWIGPIRASPHLPTLQHPGRFETT